MIGYNKHGCWVLCFGKAFRSPICSPVLPWIPTLWDHWRIRANVCSRLRALSASICALSSASFAFAAATTSGDAGVCGSGFQT